MYGVIGVVTGVTCHTCNHSQEDFKEDHPNVADVVIVGRAGDGRKRRNGGNELGGNVIC